MEKIYRRSLVAVIYNLIIMIFGVLVAFLISGVIGGYKVAIIISSIIIILVVISIFRQLKTKVIINGNRLSINDGKKEFNYNLNEVHISSEQRNNDSFFLYLYTEDGTEYLDALTGIAVCGLGHAHPVIAQAIAEQASTLIHTSNLFEIPWQTAAAQKLAEVSGMQEIFFF